MSINKIRSFLYRLASFLGDVNAAKKGKIVQRIIRKAVIKKVSKKVNKYTDW